MLRFPKHQEVAVGLLHSVYGGKTSFSNSENPSLYPIAIQGKDGTLIDFSTYAGKVLLIVNTASKCGFTKQYDELEALYEMHRDDGFLILGFPSNDFLQQEPGSDEEIESYCRINHGVSFPLFPKTSVTGDTIQPLFKALTQNGPSDLRGRVRWNFEKFLLDREGRLIGRWRSWVAPRSRSIKKAIAEALS